MVAVTLEVPPLLKSSLICIAVQQTCAEVVGERGRNPNRVGVGGRRGGRSGFNDQSDGRSGRSRGNWTATAMFFFPHFFI